MLSVLVPLVVGQLLGGLAKVGQFETGVGAVAAAFAVDARRDAKGEHRRGEERRELHSALLC